MAAATESGRRDARPTLPKDGKEEQRMVRERIIRLVAGTLVLISLALGIWVNRWWFLLTAFVGLNPPKQRRALPGQKPLTLGAITSMMAIRGLVP